MDATSSSSSSSTTAPRVRKHRQEIQIYRPGMLRNGGVAPKESVLDPKLETQRSSSVCSGSSDSSSAIASSATSSSSGDVYSFDDLRANLEEFKSLDWSKEMEKEGLIRSAVDAPIVEESPRHEEKEDRKDERRHEYSNRKNGQQAGRVTFTK
ncbi:unnamed protein product [Caenorhabditis sp. 36 PRJEB53466]|nr:unnamed protein product [Caenorhabditis sp. 36 PRJEB53466]